MNENDTVNDTPETPATDAPTTPVSEPESDAPSQDAAPTEGE